MTSCTGRPAPNLILCRQCLEYVFGDTITCPHCGRDIREIGLGYREGPYRAIEAMQQIERALEHYMGESSEASDT
jgi:hypothetical protein